MHEDSLIFLFDPKNKTTRAWKEETTFQKPQFVYYDSSTCHRNWINSRVGSLDCFDQINPLSDPTIPPIAKIY